MTEPSRAATANLFSGSPSVRGAVGVTAYAVLAFVVFPAQGRLIKGWLPGMDGSALYVIGHLAELVEVLLFAWAASRIEGRSFAAYGLPWRPALRTRFWQGAALGIASLAVLVTTLAALGGLRLGPPSQAGPWTPLIAAGYLVLFLILGFREEFLYRGYGLSTLSGQIGFGPAAMASSAWFMTAHTGNSGETVLGLCSVGLFGLLACVVLRRTGNLWMPIGFHAAWNWGQTFLFGASDSGHPAAPGHFFTTIVSKSAPTWLSGGPTGPEGSVLCAVLFVALALGVALWRGASPRGA